MDISNLRIEDTIDYVLQADPETGVVQKINGNIPENLIVSGFTVNGPFTYTLGDQVNGYVLTFIDGVAVWAPVDQYHWVNGGGITIQAGRIVTISSDYVLIDTELNISGPVNDGFGSNITISGKTYNRDGKLSVFGDMVLSDVNVNNDGVIRVDGGLILDNNTVFEGNGIII